jgi:intraflagellar transport protein 81
MEKIAFIVDRLNGEPFNKGFTTMSEFDGKPSLDLLDLLVDVVCAIDPEQESLRKEDTDAKITRILNFLRVMKFANEEQFEDVKNLLMSGDKEMLQTVLHWCLQRFEHLQKRAYLAKYLSPEVVAPEYMSDDLIVELLQRMKEMQTEFKDVHKRIDQLRGTSSRPGELKAEISRLEQEKTQLQNKISRMKKDSHHDQAYFQDMLKATSGLRKEQEEEARIQDKLREHRRALQEVDTRYNEIGKRLSEAKNSGVQKQSAEQLLSKLQRDVKEVVDRKDAVETQLQEKQHMFEKLHGFGGADRNTSEEDVRAKREQLRDVEEDLAVAQDRLDGALEHNQKLMVFRQASAMALKKVREREEALEEVLEEKRRWSRQYDDKEEQLQASGVDTRSTKMDLKKYGAIVREKIEKYKRMREELASLRGELVVLQRTEAVLKSRDEKIDEYYTQLEEEKGIKGARDEQEKVEKLTMATAEVDQAKGATLEQISQLVEQIGREFKNKQAQLQPIIAELKGVRAEYMEVEASHTGKKETFDKVAVGLDMDKQALERECDTLQDESIREESRYHYLNNLISMNKMKLERAEKERKYQQGDGRMLRDFASFDELYTNKLAQQEQLTKQLRKRQKELKENVDTLSNQKVLFKVRAVGSVL